MWVFFFVYFVLSFSSLFAGSFLTFSSIFIMRIESSLSSSSDGDRGDSPKSSLSPVSMRAAESTDDNVPIIHRHVPYRDRGGLLRRSVRTTPVSEESSDHVPVPQIVDEDVVDLEEDNEVDAADARETIFRRGSLRF